MSPRLALAPALAPLLAAALLLPATAGAAGTLGTTVAKPAGKAPLRYRDEVFSRVQVARDVPYTTVADASGTPMRLTLDRYEPAGDRARDRPAMVWVHGGGFRTGTKANANVAELARRFARRGYVAVSIDYRLLAREVCGGPREPGGGCAAAALAAGQDATAAVAWLRDHARRLRVDPRRIAIGGTSAGAVTAQLVGARPDRNHVRASVVISGGLTGTTGLLGPAAAPSLLFAGTADRTTPYDRARDNAQALAGAGVPTVLETLLGAGHVPFAQYGERFTRHSAYFLFQHLGLGRRTA